MILKKGEDLVKNSLKIFLGEYMNRRWIHRYIEKTHIFNSQKDEYHIFLDEKLS